MRDIDTGGEFEAVNGMMLDVLKAVARKDYEDNTFWFRDARICLPRGD